jgi:hypothetical protein
VYDGAKDGDAEDCGAEDRGVEDRGAEADTDGEDAEKSAPAEPEAALRGPGGQKSANG